MQSSCSTRFVYEVFYVEKREKVGLVELILLTEVGRLTWSLILRPRMGCCTIRAPCPSLLIIAHPYVIIKGNKGESDTDFCGFLF